ncbi:hypothetical protein [Dichotomicrobium thermohalophilum]|uniref:Uncharacterized protein n=1 Tax=Dichotomicrobium thermohalophilum TaxID=933063 RepID=A0A397Q533_9HYPH|nr:hypothetical protein [Dichotomicrobium thermohalophilum]RIA56212.1 hypothetical protein BXY53_1314 [Dichotomicrobium thermohalophilum]
MALSQKEIERVRQNRRDRAPGGAIDQEIERLIEWRENNPEEAARFDRENWHIIDKMQHDPTGTPPGGKPLEDLYHN